MTWRGTVKAAAMVLLITAGVAAIVFGGVQLLFGRPWWRLGGLALIVAGFRTVILAMDVMLGRPQVWSRHKLVRQRARNPDAYRHH